MASIAERFGRVPHKMLQPSKELAIPTAKVGIEVEVEEYKVDVVNPNNPFWTVKPDGSLRNNGMEFVTIGGMVGEEIEKAVEWLCDVAIKNKLSTGYPRAGIHIHMDVTDMNSTDSLELARLMQTAMILEPAMFAYAGEHRRACGFCDAFQDSSADFNYISDVLFRWDDKTLTPNINRLLSEDTNYISKYQAINLLPLSRFGTLEFRQLPTTFDKQRIMDWINVILCLKRFAQSFRGDVVALAKEIGGKVFFERVLERWLPVLGPHYTDEGFNAGLITAQLIQLRNRNALKPLRLVKPLDGLGKGLLETKVAKRRAKTPRNAAPQLLSEEDRLRELCRLRARYPFEDIVAIIERIQRLREEVETVNDVPEDWFPELRKHPDFYLAFNNWRHYRDLQFVAGVITIRPEHNAPKISVIVNTTRASYFNPVAMAWRPYPQLNADPAPF